MKLTAEMLLNIKDRSRQLPVVCAGDYSRVELRDLCIRHNQLVEEIDRIHQELKQYAKQESLTTH